MPETTAAQTHWFCSGREIFPAMLQAIRSARRSIELETYIYSDSRIGGEFRQALLQAARSGVRIRVLADSYGSLTLPDGYFSTLIQAGGEVRFFNPLRFLRFGVRDHRKLLVCDGETVFVGGANVSDEYDGDGITEGWFDTAIRIHDVELAESLSAEFDGMFESSSYESRPKPRLRVFRKLRRHITNGAKILAVQPGRGAGIFQRALQRDLSTAATVDFISPYFLPNRRLRKLLRRIVQRGGRVRLILPANCDVPIARAAALVYYARLLRGGVEIFEFQPQVLHAKLYIADGSVYVGSSNLDVRSFKLNYELMLRFTDAEILDGAKRIFSEALKHSRQVKPEEFRQSQNLWERWKNRWSHFLLARIDPLIALNQIKTN